MAYTISEESFDSLCSYWRDPGLGLQWSSVFVLPAWLGVWWQAFGAGNGLRLLSIKEGERLIGIAPLMLKGNAASLVGSVDVCDYLDFVVLPGKEEAFFDVLLGHLKGSGVTGLDLCLTRPDSVALTHLVPLARERGYEVDCHREDVSFEVDLPGSWEEYLELLPKKHRHETRRKLRRLYEYGNTVYRYFQPEEGVGDLTDQFLRLFSLSREDKARFMTPAMQSFFRTLAGATARAGLLRFGVLELNNVPVAMIMCFNYDGCVYLYNSGYDPQYDSLSVGLLCKVLSIKQSIEDGQKRYDFLKGTEAYKYHLGGQEIPLHHCEITIT